MGKRTVLEGEHVYPNGTISLTLVSIFIRKKKDKKKWLLKPNTIYYKWISPLLLQTQMYTAGCISGIQEIVSSAE